MSYRSRDPRRWWRCLPGALLLALISGAAAQDHPGSPNSEGGLATAIVEARIDGGLLTLRADGAPLADVLRAIGKAGAFPVVIRGELAAPVSASFTDHPLEGALRELVSTHALIVMRKEPSAPAFAEIRVIENRAAAGVEDVEVPQDVADEGAHGGEADDGPPLDRASFREAQAGMPPPTRDDLLFELDDADQAARVAAVPKVGSLPPREAVEMISYVFANDDDTTVRSRAVAALTRFEGPGARALLRERALGDDDPGLRMQALNALAASRGERAINVIAAALRQDSEPKVRMSAIRALGRVGGDWARHSLERAARDADPDISLAAEQALAAWPQPHN